MAPTELEEYAREVKPGSTFVHVAFYFDNFLTFFPLRDQGDGTFSFGFPQEDTPLAGVAVDDAGGVVAAIFSRRDQFRDRMVGIVGDDLPPAKYAEIMTRVLGRKVVYNYIPSRRTDLVESRSLYPAMQSFETWMKAHEDEFRLQPSAARGTSG